MRIYHTLISSLFLFLIANMVKAQTWEQVSSPPNNFFTDHTFGFGLDGMGYLVTGTDLNGNISNDFYQYSPTSDSWTQLDDFPGGARGYAIGDTWDGKAYFGFGLGNGLAFNDLWVFDPALQTWERLSDCPCEARLHPALVAHNNKIYMGLGGGNGNLKDWWIYDIMTDTWSQGADLPAAPRHHPYQFGIGEYVYAGFGHGNGIFNDWYQYDPQNDSWTEVASLPAEGRVAGTQFSYNGKGYALSGEGESHSAMDEGEFWMYDPILDEWSQLPSHPGTSRWAPASFVIEDEVYLFNGTRYLLPSGSNTYIQEAFKYDLNATISNNEDFNTIEKITISPNPTTEYVNIELPIEWDIQNLTLKVLNLEGKLLLKSVATNSININDLSQGTYLLEWEYQGKTDSQIIIKN